MKYEDAWLIAQLNLFAFWISLKTDLIRSVGRRRKISIMMRFDQIRGEEKPKLSWDMFSLILSLCHSVQVTITITIPITIIITIIITI